MGAEVIQFDPSRRRGGRARPKPKLVAADQAPPGLPVLAAWDSWAIALEARNVSARTVEVYLLVVRSFVAWAEDMDACSCHADGGADCPAGRPLDGRGQGPGVEHITRDAIRRYLTHRRITRSPGDAHKHFRVLRSLYNWLIEDGEIPGPSPVAKADEPKVPEKVFPPLTDDELRALLAACKGDSFEARRDTAIIRVLVDNGIRVEGLAGIRYTPNNPDTQDVHLSRYTLRIVLKGGDEHLAPIGKKAAAALDRYVRARARRPDAAVEERLWLGKKGPMTRWGIAQMLDRRGRQAGIEGKVGPHRFRRTMADNFLAADGDPLDLMRIGGWKSLAMVQHYTGARADVRARQAHARLSPGDRI